MRVSSLNERLSHSGSQRRSLVSRGDMPEQLREPGITGYYRRLGISKTDCMTSVFQIHNETLNIWTHLLSTTFFLFYLVRTWQTVDLLSEYYRPLLCVMISSCIYPIGSAVAHTFHCMSLCSNDICAMIDYLGVSVYAFATGLGTRAYAMPLPWLNTSRETYFSDGNFLCCLLALMMCCQSRFRAQTHDVTGSVTRVVAVAIPYLYSMLPCIYRVYQMLCCGRVSNFYYLYHFICSLIVVLIYVSHCPEVLFPGKFDVYFHSHQIFHAVVCLGTYFKLAGLRWDIEIGYTENHLVGSLEMLVILSAVNVSVAMYYIRKMYRRYHSSLLRFDSDSNNNFKREV